MKMFALAELFPLLLKRHGDIPELQQGMLKIAWNYCVGEQIRQASKPISYQDGVLHVRVMETHWRSTLQSMKPQIISKINQYLGKQIVSELKIEV